MNREQRILVLAPVGRDGPLARRALEEAGMDGYLCTGMSELCAELELGAGAALLTEEGLDDKSVMQLTQALQRQPPWSDFPVVLFAGSLLPELGELANFTVLERPVKMRTLLSAMRSALRARNRQYHARAMLEELSRSVRDRDQFLAMLGHELRNPLAGMLTAIELMERGRMEGFARERQILGRQTRQLGRLVDDLLDVARVTTGKIGLRKAPLELGELLRRMLPDWQTRARDRGLTISLAAKGDARVQGDPLRLEQVLNNLVGNALKYTPAGGHIQVSLERDAGEAVLRVADDGIGIDPAMLPRVFDLFIQADPALDRAQGGMGIGLTVVRRLVELHGGSIAARSEGTGRGSVFEVRLPMFAGSEAVRAPARGEPPPSRRRVMVVEDNDDTRELLTAALQQAGHEVTASPDGIDAFDAAVRHPPEVMLIDIGLPGRDGYQLARDVRKALGGQPRLIALTGYGQPEDRRRALDAGFDDHLTKPVDLDTLEAAVAAGRKERPLS